MKPFVNHLPIWIAAAFSVPLSMVCSTATAQQPFDCGTVEEMPDPPMPVQNACFDVSDVLTNCTPIYLRVNVHFFLDEDCDGLLDTEPGVPEEVFSSRAFSLADLMITRANDFYDLMNAGMNIQWNQAEHGATITGHQCMPLRYVLSGVHIHCVDEFSGEYGSAVYGQYKVNEGDEINVFVHNVPSGFNGFYWPPETFVVVEKFEGGLFNHELGHHLSLSHTHVSNDGCADTWHDPWHYDSDCDGTIDQTGNTCWHTDNVYGGIDYCDPLQVCAIFPCCEQENQNNNVMTYSAWAGNPAFAALTPCQINRVMAALDGTYCDYIESIDANCPPPQANIGIVPGDGEDPGDCTFCVYFEASMNDEEYFLTIEEILPGGGTMTIAETGWEEGPAGRYCIFNVPEYGEKNRHDGLYGGGTYLFELEVKNICGQTHLTSLTITIPVASGNCYEDENEIHLTATPNPFSGNFDMDFTTDADGEVEIYLIEAISGQRLVLWHTPNTQAGSYAQQVNLSGCLNGVFYLIYRLDSELHSITLLKVS